MSGEQGDDTYLGGAGDDFIFATADESRRGKDEIHCGPGVDEVLANRKTKDTRTTTSAKWSTSSPTRRSPDKADRRAAKAEQKRAQADFLARRDADR